MRLIHAPCAMLGPWRNRRHGACKPPGLLRELRLPVPGLQFDCLDLENTQSHRLRICQGCRATLIVHPALKALLKPFMGCGWSQGVSTQKPSVRGQGFVSRGALKICQRWLSARLLLRKLGWREGTRTHRNMQQAVSNI